MYTGRGGATECQRARRPALCPYGTRHKCNLPSRACFYEDSRPVRSDFPPSHAQDFNLIDHLAHFDRERIPERVVHAKGAGAMGYFEVGPALCFHSSISRVV